MPAVSCQRLVQKSFALSGWLREAWPWCLQTQHRSGQLCGRAGLVVLVCVGDQQKLLGHAVQEAPPSGPSSVSDLMGQQPSAADRFQHLHVKWTAHRMPSGHGKSSAAKERVTEAPLKQACSQSENKWPAAHGADLLMQSNMNAAAPEAEAAGHVVPKFGERAQSACS